MDRKHNGVVANLQALRLLAASIVIFVHLDVLMAAVGLPTFGEKGVDLFFVISGFIMVYTTHGRAVSPQGFMLNRLLRVAPTYWVITLVVFGIALVAPALLRSTQADPVQLAKSLAFIPFVKPNGLVQPVHFVGWTLNYEMFFYLLFAAGLGFKDDRKGLLATGLVLAALVLAGVLFSPSSVLARFYTDPIMLEFAFGMAIAAYVVREPPVPSGAARWLLAAALALAAVVLVLGDKLYPDAPRLLVGGLPALVMVLAAVELERAGWVFAGPKLIIGGGATYSIYLTHPFVTQVHQILFNKLGGGPTLAWAMLVSTLVGVLVVGLLAHYGLERPLTRLLKERFSRQRQPPRPAVQQP